MDIDVSSFSSQFITILDEIGKKVGVAIDWTNANITPYLTDLFHRYNKYIILEKGFNVFFDIIFFIVGIVLLRKAVKKGIEQIQNNGIYITLFIIGVAIIVIGFFSLIWSSIPSFLKAIYVPEYFVLQVFNGQQGWL